MIYHKTNIENRLGRARFGTCLGPKTGSKSTSKGAPKKGENKTSSKPEPQQHFRKTINISQDREQKSKLLRGPPLGGPLLAFLGGENAHGIVK